MARQLTDYFWKNINHDRSPRFYAVRDDLIMGGVAREYKSLAEAEERAGILAREYPGCEFVVFESTSSFKLGSTLPVEKKIHVTE